MRMRRLGHDTLSFVEEVWDLQGCIGDVCGRKDGLHRLARRRTKHCPARLYMRNVQRAIFFETLSLPNAEQPVPPSDASLDAAALFRCFRDFHLH